MRDITSSSIIGLKQLPYSDPKRLPILMNNETVGTLRFMPGLCVGLAAKDAELMANWRNQQSKAFFTWIRATKESTEQWLLENYMRKEDDLMCMLENAVGTPFGHMAIYNFSADGKTCEFGRVLRGNDKGPVSGMYFGALTLLRWAAQKLQVTKFYLEVFADNRKAIALYERIGFKEEQVFPLTCIEHPDRTIWMKASADEKFDRLVDKFAVRMSLDSIGLLD